MTDKWAQLLDDATKHPRWETLPESTRRRVTDLLGSARGTVEWANAVLDLVREQPALAEILPPGSLASLASSGRDAWPGPGGQGPPMLNWRCGEPGCPTHDYGDRYAPYILDRCPTHQRPLERGTDD